jgi:hypothetical protein
VDQVWAKGTDPIGGGLYYERNSNQHRRLQVFETGSEDCMTGGWVRVLASAERVRKERPGMERAAGGVHGRSLRLSRHRRAPVGFVGRSFWCDSAAVGRPVHLLLHGGARGADRAIGRAAQLLSRRFWRASTEGARPMNPPSRRPRPMPCSRRPTQR